MGGAHYFVLRQGGGQIFVTSLHFTTKKRLCLHYHNQNRILQAKIPAQYSLVSTSLKHVLLHISGQAPAFSVTSQEKDRLEVPCDEF